MCRLFGFRSIIKSMVHKSLLAAENAIAVQSSRHRDGWGLAFYLGNRIPHTIKSALPANADNIFSKVSGVVASETVLAHIRQATTGDKNILNSHPFQHGNWVFAHNGQINNFPQHKAKLIRHIAPSLRRFILGDTDSEVFFFLFISELSRRSADIHRAGTDIHDVASAMAASVSIIVDTCDTPGGASHPHPQPQPQLQLQQQAPGAASSSSSTAAVSNNNNNNSNSNSRGHSTLAAAPGAASSSSSSTSPSSPSSSSCAATPTSSDLPPNSGTSLLTCIVTDGHSMLGLKWHKDLLYSTYKGAGCPDRHSCPSYSFECENATKTGHVNHFVLASEPLQGQNTWHQLRNGDVVAVDWRMMLHRGSLQQNGTVHLTRVGAAAKNSSAAHDDDYFHHQHSGGGSGAGAMAGAGPGGRGGACG